MCVCVCVCVCVSVVVRMAANYFVVLTAVLLSLLSLLDGCHGDRDELDQRYQLIENALINWVGNVSDNDNPELDMTTVIINCSTNQ